MFLQFGEEDYDNIGDDDYDDYSKELNQYKKSKDRGRGEFGVCVCVSSLLFLKKRLIQFRLSCCLQFLYQG